MQRALLPVLLFTALAGFGISWTPDTALAREVTSPDVEKARKAILEKVRYKHTEFEMEITSETEFAPGLFVENLRYPSPVESSSERNDTVRARLFRKTEPQAAAVIVLGGWRFDPLTPALAAKLAETGIQALYISIPFQERRTPRGESPGALTLSADLDRNEAVFVQLAQDVARARHWLIQDRKIPPERIGIMGTSLGGFAVATLYGMDDRFHCAAVLLAGADVAGVIFNGNRLTHHVRAQLVRKGVDETAARKRMVGMSPGTWARKERGGNLLLMAAEKDTVVPLATVEKLSKLYGKAKIELLKGQPHITPDAVRERFPKVMEHFEKMLLSVKTPSTKKTPTKKTPATK